MSREGLTGLLDSTAIFLWTPSPGEVSRISASEIPA